MKLRVQGINKGSCHKCASHNNPDYYEQKKMLPIWYKDGIPQFKLPLCLKKLHHAEKLLIQRLSAFIPLHHLMKGNFGIKGHCCAFNQDVNEFINRLPRKHDDVAFLKVIQAVKSEIGSNRTSTRHFKVRRKEVLEALYFLKKYSTEYKDITIDESALDWIEGEEAFLEGYEIETENEEDISTQEHDKEKNNLDRGPAPMQAAEPEEESDIIKPFGYIDEGAIGEISQEDKEITNGLKETIKASSNKRNITMDWPTKDSTPICEYGNTKIFANAFPWLFPGGIGDIKDYNGDMKDWGKMLLYYEDGRFARDKMFCFFAMNYITRNRNSR